MGANDTSDEFVSFTKLVDRVLAVPHSVIQKRVEEHRRKAEQNPRRRGPKRKVKPSSSGRASRAKD